MVTFTDYLHFIERSVTSPLSKIITSDTIIYLISTVIVAFIGSVIYNVQQQFFTNYRQAPIYPAIDPALNQHTATGPRRPCKSPATGVDLGSVSDYTAADIQQAVALARKAQDHYYRKANYAERRALLYDILDWVVDNQQLIIQWSVEATGKVVTEAAVGEILTTCEKIRWLAQYGEYYLQRETRTVPPLLAFTKRAYVDWYPVGVMGVIVPWNYPVHNVLSHAVTSLIAGNAAVIKVSEYAAHTAPLLDKVLRTLIARRGYDPNLIQVIPGSGEAGAALVTHSDKLLFIGSPQVGKAVMRTAADSLTPVTLELGGKDPFIICNDADFSQVIDTALLGAFINNGQNCVSAERFYVQAEVYDKFIAEVQQRVAKLQTGSPTLRDNATAYDTSVSFGAITMPQQIKTFDRLIADAQQKGAKLVAGGKRTADSNGSFYHLTVLSDVTHDMEVANEEAFGPLMTIIKFTDDRHLLQMVNSTRYGLGSSIFTTDLARAERLSARLQCGMANINDFASVPLINSLPFGGVKDSGFGCFNGIEGLRGFCRQQSVVTDRWTYIRTKLPPFLRYPYYHRANQIVQQATKMVYGKSYLYSGRALVQMIRLMTASNQPVNDKGVNHR